MFKTLRDYLNQNFESYIREWFLNAYRVNSITWKTGDFNDTKPINKNKGSLSFNMRDRYAKDFNSGEKAGDIIAIYAKRFCNGDNKIALYELIEKYHLEYLFPDNNFINKNNGNDNENTHNANNSARSNGGSNSNNPNEVCANSSHHNNNSNNNENGNDNHHNSRSNINISSNNSNNSKTKIKEGNNINHEEYTQNNNTVSTDTN
ncbi:MAG: hypothetical protein LBG48_02920, partial [Rickettsiales bacterium]|nr:hypothetical protein [Rickettsiales bacterium]